MNIQISNALDMLLQWCVSVMQSVPWVWHYLQKMNSYSTLPHRHLCRYVFSGHLDPSGGNDLNLEQQYKGCLPALHTMQVSSTVVAASDAIERGRKLFERDGFPPLLLDNFGSSCLRGLCLQIDKLQQVVDSWL